MSADILSSRTSDPAGRFSHPSCAFPGQHPHILQRQTCLDPPLYLMRVLTSLDTVH